MTRRRNPDDNIRKLERLAAMGDPDAQKALDANRYRTVSHEPPEKLSDWTNLAGPSEYAWAHRYEWDTNRPTNNIIYQIAPGYAGNYYSLIYYPDTETGIPIWASIGDRYKTRKQAIAAARRHYSDRFGKKTVRVSTRKNEHGEWSVQVLSNGRVVSTYLTDDKVDAISTGEYIQRRIDAGEMI